MAVIGTGASAMQFVPEIASVVGELLCSSARRPGWCPRPTTTPRCRRLRWLYEHVPAYSEIHRFCIFWRMGDGVLATVQVDPDWDVPGSVSAANAMVQALFTDYIKQQFADRPDLLEVVVPNYPPGAKRMIRDNGVWARALKRDNVRLVTTGIREITPRGIVTVDGTAHDVDVIIYGTGFTASKFLAPMKVTGRGGVDLHEHWQGGPRLPRHHQPGFPTCSASTARTPSRHQRQHHLLPSAVRYIMGLIEMALRGERAVDVRREVHDRFNEEVDGPTSTWPGAPPT